jgi:hypothetical protein
LRSKRSSSREVENLSLLSSSSSFSTGEDAEPEEVNILHLELFRHFIHEHSTLFGYHNSINGALSLDVTDMLFVAPYLMSQSLAFAALHLSATVPTKHNLRKHATRLQDHALAIFNSMDLNLDVGNCASIFFFKSIHALHMLSEKLSDRSKSFDSFLDDATDVMRLYQDVHAITRKTWDILLQSALSPLLERESYALSQGIPGTECDELSALVHAAPINNSLRDIYLEAIDCLQKSFDGSRKCDLKPHTIGPIIAWLVIVPPSFIDLVDKRQPEALVIVSYFGALLHMHREVWAFGSSGMYIIDSITSYLDESWNDWLYWPNTFR